MNVGVKLLRMKMSPGDFQSSLCPKGWTPTMTDEDKQKDEDGKEGESLCCVLMMNVEMNRRMKMKTRMKKKMKMGKKTREGKRLEIDNEFVLCHTPPLLSTRGERIVFLGPNTNTNIIRVHKFDRIRIRILFVFVIMTEYEYEYYSGSEI